MTFYSVTSFACSLAVSECRQVVFLADIPSLSTLSVYMSLKSFAPNSPPIKEEQDFKKWWIRPGRRHWIDPSPLFIICARSRETSAASWQMGRPQEERIKKSRLQFSLLPISRPPPHPPLLPPTERLFCTSLVKERNIDNWVRVRKRQEIRVWRSEEHLKWWASRLYLEDQLNVQDIYDHSKLQDEKVSNLSEILTSCGEC